MISFMLEELQGQSSVNSWLYSGLLMGGYSTESVRGGGRHYKAFFMNSRQNKEFWVIFCL